MAFDDVQIRNEDTDFTVSEHFSRNHNPDLLRDYIDLLLDRVKNIEDEELRAYQTVEILRATMQYVEEFGMYIINQVRDKSLVENLTDSASTRDVQRLYKRMRHSNLEIFLNEEEVTSDEEFVKHLMAYDLLLDGDISVDLDDKGTDKTEDDLVDESVHNLLQRFQTIGDFFIGFYDVYNAIKHGNRVVHLGSSTFKIQGQEIIESDVVQILCKRSGTSKPYLAKFPPTFLVEVSKSNLNKVSKIFSQMRSMTKAKQGATQDEANMLFFQDADTKESQEYIKITNQSNTIFLPKNENLDKFIEEGNDTVRILGDLHVEDNKLVFKASPERLVELEVELTVEGESPRPGVVPTNFSFDIPIYDMDVVTYRDYYDMKEAAENGEIEHLHIKDQRGLLGTGELVEASNQFSHMPQYNGDREHIEFLIGLQKATDQTIPTPEFVSEEQARLIDENRSEDLNREEAEELLSSLRDYRCGKTVFETLENTLCIRTGVHSYDLTFKSGEELNIVEKLEELDDSKKISVSSSTPHSFNELTDWAEDSPTEALNHLLVSDESGEKKVAVSFELVRDNLWIQLVKITLSKVQKTSC